jgi:hypothetical protein
MFIFFKIYYLSLSYKIKPVPFHPPVFAPSFVGHYHVTRHYQAHLPSPRILINTYRPVSTKSHVAAPLRHPLQIRYGVESRSLLAAIPRSCYSRGPPSERYLLKLYLYFSLSRV